MPRLDGTGPKGEGPFTGGSRGYCMLRLPDRPNQPATGFAGLVGRFFRTRPSALSRPLLGLGLGRRGSRRRR